MDASGNGGGSTGIKIGPGASAHLEDVHVEGFDTPIDIDRSAKATFRNVTTAACANFQSRTHNAIRSGSMSGWTRAVRFSFDPRASATIASHLDGKNPFDDPKQLIDRARDHIRNLEARIAEFWARGPFAKRVERNEGTGQEIHKVALTENLPDKAATIAKDAFSNLRDALDHAVYASAITLRPQESLHRTAFPFARDAAGVHDKLNRELLDIPPDIRTLLEALCPHQNGNQLLWGLNSTRNVETHRIIVPLLVASIGNSLRINGEVKGQSQIGRSQWDGTRNEAEYLRVGLDSKVEYNLQVSFSVLLGDVEVLGGEPVIDTLYKITTEIEGTILAVETETARLLR